MANENEHDHDRDERNVLRSMRIHTWRRALMSAVVLVGVIMAFAMNQGWTPAIGWEDLRVLLSRVGIGRDPRLTNPTDFSNIRVLPSRPLPHEIPVVPEAGCYITVPGQCASDPKVDGTFHYVSPYDSLGAVESCERYVARLIETCRFSWDSLVHVEFHRTDGTINAIDVAPLNRAVCRITIPETCKKSPGLSLKFDDNTDGSADEPDRCAERPREIARWCGFPAGATVVAEFRVPNEPPQPFPYTAEANIPALPRTPVFRCQGGAPKGHPALWGYVEGDGAGCIGRGFESASRVFSLAPVAGDGRRALHSYGRLDGDTWFELPAHEADKPTEPGTEQVGLLGYDFIEAGTTPELTPVFRCFDPGDPRAAFMSLDPECEATGMQKVQYAFAFP